jgi:hypothetical protein
MIVECREVGPLNYIVASRLWLVVTHPFLQMKARHANEVDRSASWRVQTVLLVRLFNTDNVFVV